MNAQGQEKLIISGLLGYGFGMNRTVFDSRNETLQPYSYGGSLRIGLRFDNDFYLGLSATFHNGESIEVTAPAETHSLQTRIQYYGIELGSFIQLNSQIFLCPYFGIGAGRLRGNFWGDKVSFNGNSVVAYSTGIKPYISPGAIIQLMAGNKIIVGLDFRYTTFEVYEHANATSLFLFIGIEI
jgi:hypothetical protein